jgi:quaternary ammonium compound-resistance protein SugE
MTRPLQGRWRTPASPALARESSVHSYRAVYRLFSLSLKALPVGRACAAWTGFRAVGTAALGMMIFNEPATFGRLGFIALNVTGIVGLKVTSSH